MPHKFLSWNYFGTRKKKQKCPKSPVRAFRRWGVFFLRWSKPWEPTGGHRAAGCDPAASLPNTASASTQPGGRAGGEEPRWSEAQRNSPLIYQPTPCLCPFYLYDDDDDDVAADGGRWKLHSDLRRCVWDGVISKNTTAAPRGNKHRRAKWRN